MNACKRRAKSLDFMRLDCPEVDVLHVGDVVKVYHGGWVPGQKPRCKDATVKKIFSSGRLELDRNGQLYHSHIGSLVEVQGTRVSYANAFKTLEDAMEYVQTLEGHVCVGRFQWRFHVLQTSTLPIWFEHYGHWFVKEGNIHA